MARVADQIVEILHGKRHAPLLQRLLKGASHCYRVAVAIRNWGYEHRLLRTYRLPKVVISVGNIAACGTGKTPFVHLLASRLKTHLSLAVLTRGFKSQVERSLASKQIPADLSASAQEYGDEPLLLARKTGLPIWVGVDRVHSGQCAIRTGADCLLLDDGLQHRRLERDMDIILIDGQDPFCQKRFLPYGFLRDSLSRLRDASLLVATHVTSHAHYRHLQEMLSSYSSAPLIGVQVQATGTISLPGVVGVFCGIGRPERFVQTVRDLNQEIVDTLFCADHEVPTEENLRLFAQRCLVAGAQALVCTEKDAIKLPPSQSLPLPVIPIPIEMKIIAGEAYMQQLVETIVKKVKS